MGVISSFGGSANPIVPPATVDKTNNLTALKSQPAPSNNAASAPAEDAATTSSYQTQLTRLSTVLSGFHLTSQLRPQAVHAANQIKAGTYKVDSQQVSKSLVSDHLGPDAVNRLLN